MWEGGKSWASLIVGIVIIALGAIPIAQDIGMITWEVPKGPEIEMVLLIILAIASFYLAINGFMEILINPGIGYASIGIGCVVGLASALKILNQFSSVLGYFESTLLNVVFFIVGSLLLLGAFMF